MPKYTRHDLVQMATDLADREYQTGEIQKWIGLAIAAWIAIGTVALGLSLMVTGP